PGGAGPGRGDGRRRRRGGSGRPAAGPRRTPGGPPGTRADRDLLAQGGLAADGAGAGQRRTGVRGRGRVGRRRGAEGHVRVRARPGPRHRRRQPAQPGQAHPGPGTATGRGLVTTRTARLSCHTLARHAVLTGDDYSLGTTRYGGASMQVLVTGGTGVIGRALVDALRERDAGVRVLSRRPPPDAAVPGVTYVHGDLDTGAGLAAAVADVDVIAHCATAADYRRPERDVAQARQLLAAVGDARPH